MGNTEERVAAVKQRVKEIRRQKQIRQGRVAGISSAAASLLIIIGLAFAMPGVMAGLPDSEYAYSGTAASIFDSGGAYGYVLIGLLSFILGVSITILCYRIHRRNLKSREEAKKRNG